MSSRASEQSSATSSLLKTPGFIPLFWCQFLGALNDNIFKSALLVIIAFRFATQPDEVAQLNNLAAALLIFPFLIISPLAGQLADRYEKSGMIYSNKIAELCICLIGTFALALGSLPLMMAVLFALGTQSAMFGPNKYAVLPQLLPPRLLVKGNAQIASATFVAILLGALLGGVLANASTVWLWVGGTTVLIASAGLVAAKRLPELEIAAPDLKLDLNILREARRGLKVMRGHPELWMALIGISWFWFLGSAYLTQLPALARFNLAGDEILVSQLILVFILGICGGAFLSARLSDNLPEMGTVPVGLLVVSLASLHLSWIQTQSITTGTLTLLSAMDIHLLGWAGGMVGVPLYATLQHKSGLANRARVIAANNIANAIFMICSAILGMLVLGIFQRPLSDFFVVLASLNMLLLIWFLRRLMRPFLRLLAALVARCHYKLHTSGLDNIPGSGAAILVSNHVSYADAIILMATVRRPIRFIMTRDIYEHSWLNWILKAAGCIPVSSPLQDRESFQASFAEAVNTLRQGELLFIFPEGRLTPDGNLQPFKRGVEKILHELEVPVIPLCISGMWGSFFSHGNGPVFRKRPGLLCRPIRVTAGEPMASPNAKDLEKRVSDLLNEMT